MPKKRPEGNGPVESPRPAFLPLLRAGFQAQMHAFNVNAESTQTIICAYCGQSFEVAIEPALRGQEMITDCEVCCRPLRVRIPIDLDAPPESEPA